MPQNMDVWHYLGTDERRPTPKQHLDEFQSTKISKMKKFRNKNVRFPSVGQPCQEKTCVSGFHQTGRTTLPCHSCFLLPVDRTEVAKCPNVW